MERNHQRASIESRWKVKSASRSFLYPLALLALATLSACATKPPKESINPEIKRVLEEAKPVIDPKLMDLCETSVPTVSADGDFAEFAYSFSVAVTNLRKCACRNIEMRNVLCKITRPGCEQVPVCTAKFSDPKPEEKVEANQDEQK